MSDRPATRGGMRRQPRQARSQERVNRILDVAEELFASQGYAATTTNAIAARAQVPIGSLYQFFPDKTAILQALAERYGEMLHQQLMAIHEIQPFPSSLADYVEQLIDTTNCFFAEHPSYYAIFMEVQGTIRELETINEATDAKIIRDLSHALAQWSANLEPADCEVITFVLVKAIGTLLWLSLSQPPTFRQQLVRGTKRLALSYLQSYFPSDSGGDAGNP